ncbi:variable surface protein [Plasmodium gonderi]|uniref:Variable surface protein n=1 Tax=Plasmodium gonderi TaxID=77519 RepID=A0A1Y1JS71_PLAGO|nr:variable surface protein [Plasmodium gonderi]GAW84315.1 variable surface protein [Plasmodium gonderi]
MAKNIYKFVKKFPELKKIMENGSLPSDSVETGNCSSFKNEEFSTLGSYVEEICKKVENYQQNVAVNSTFRNTEFPCIYLYYWLYFYNRDTKKCVSEFISLYQNLINFLDLNYCNDYFKNVYTTITDDEMSKLKVLDDMYTNLKNIENNSNPPCKNKCSCANECAELYMKYKGSCESNNYSDFCNELKNVRHKYNALNTIKNCDELTYKILPLLQKNNIRIPIVITILFVPYNLCFQRTLRRKQNKWNNKDEDYNIFQSYKNVKSGTMKSRHHILYHKV